MEGKDESPASFLWMSVIGGVDDSPLDAVTRIVKTPQDDAESLAPLI